MGCTVSLIQEISNNFPTIKNNAVRLKVRALNTVIFNCYF